MSSTGIKYLKTSLKIPSGWILKLQTDEQREYWLVRRRTSAASNRESGHSRPNLLRSAAKKTTFLSRQVDNQKEPRVEKANLRVHPAKTTMASRRSQIFAYFNACLPDELGDLLFQLLAPFGYLLVDSETLSFSRLNAANSVWNGQTLCSMQPTFVALRASIHAVHPFEASVSTQMGFLMMFSSILSQLRTLCHRFLPHFLTLCLYMLHRAISRLASLTSSGLCDEEIENEVKDEDEDEEDLSQPEEEVEDAVEGVENLHQDRDIQSSHSRSQDVASLKKIRLRCLQIFAQLLNVFPNEFAPKSPLAPFVYEFFSITTTLIHRLPTDGYSHRGGLLN